MPAAGTHEACCRWPANCTLVTFGVKPQWCHQNGGVAIRQHLKTTHGKHNLRMAWRSTTHSQSLSRASLRPYSRMTSSSSEVVTSTKGRGGNEIRKESNPKRQQKTPGQRAAQCDASNHPRAVTSQDNKASHYDPSNFIYILDLQQKKKWVTSHTHPYEDRVGWGATNSIHTWLVSARYPVRYSASSP